MVLELLGLLVLLGQVEWEDARSGLIISDGPEGPPKGAMLSDGLSAFSKVDRPTLLSRSASHLLASASHKPNPIFVLCLLHRSTGNSWPHNY